MKPRLIIVGPVPPPVHGVTISTSLVLANPFLRERFEVEHFDTSDHRGLGNVGTWDLRNVSEALRHVVRLPLDLRGRPGIVYLPISQGIPGLARDTMFIHAAAAKGWRVAVHLRGSELGDVYRRQRPLTQAWLRTAFSRIDSFAVLGESLRERLETIIDRERIAVVPNGTPDPGPPSEDGGGPGLYLANLYRRKGVLEAAQAALLVLDEAPDARFIFAGGGGDAEVRRRLDEARERSGGRIDVREAVRGPAKEKMLAAAGYLLFPPVEPEGHPRVVLEAIAAGLPVITTDRGAIAETVIDEECGYVLPDPDPAALAERMVRLHTQPELRARLAAGARRRYLDHFTQEETDRRFADWLSGLVP